MGSSSRVSHLMPISLGLDLIFKTVSDPIF
jgi:hypothetical protein